jgi:hypothetical protein
MIKAGSGSTTFGTTTGFGHLVALGGIGFGKTFTNNTAYYTSILNDDSTFGIRANKSEFTMNFRGLGLPTDQYNIFVNLLSVLTNGESTCPSYKGGYCVLAKPCSFYTAGGLWDYDFKIQF